MRFPFFRSKDKDRASAPAARPALGGDDAAVQSARAHARRRLVGALVLLVAGVAGFPMIFDTQPRPLSVDTPIWVPEGTPARVAAAPSAAVRPLPSLPPDAGAESAVTPVPAGSAPVASAPVATAAAPVAAAPVTAAPVTAIQSAASKAGTASTATTANTANTAPKPADPPQAAAVGRFVVQVGAYNDVERLRAARAKLEKLGFKSYTQDVESPTGKRTRVRVGPYGSRQEAENAAAKVKAAGMQTAILSL
jgi:DedD protein